MKEITSLNNEYIKKIAKLKDKKHRNEEKKFLIEGFHLIEEAYKANILIELFVVKAIEKYNDIPQVKVNEKIIEKLSSTNSPQSIIGVCKIKDNTKIRGNKILLLDNINDPGNMGTLIRSSLGFGIDTIVISEDSVDVYNEKTVRATQGALFHSNIVVDNLEKCIKSLKEENITIIGTSLKSSKPLSDIKNKDKYAIILGNEANGVKEKLLKQTDINVKIEMNEKLESLNVAVAGSIIMYMLSIKEEEK